MMGMGGYIDKFAFERRCMFDPSIQDMQDVIYALRDYPVADVRLVVRAEWISVPHKKARVCSRCYCDEPYKFADTDSDVYDFCPHCGADMRKVET